MTLVVVIPICFIESVKVRIESDSVRRTSAVAKRAATIDFIIFYVYNNRQQFRSR